MVLSNGTPKNKNKNKNKKKKINLPKIVAYGTFRRNRLHSAARTKTGCGLCGVCKGIGLSGAVQTVDHYFWYFSPSSWYRRC